MARVGSLFVDLRANTAAFSSGLDKARGKARGFASGIGDQLKMVGIGFAAIGTAAVAAGVKLIGSSLQQADALAKLSKQTGITVESLSGLGFAAEQSGIDQQFLADRLVNLQRRAFKSTESVNSYTKAFQTLGVNVTDSSGNLKDTETLLLEVADAFAGMEDGTAKAALATEIFSNQGVKLIPLLNQGAAGINKSKDEAESFGQVMTKETALAAEQFNDNLNKLKKTLQGVGNVILAELAPTMVDLTERTVAWVKESEAVSFIGQLFSVVFKTIVTAAKVFVGQLKNIIIGLRTLAAAGQLALEGEFGTAIETLKQGFTELKTNTTDTVKSIVGTWKGGTTQISAALDRQARAAKQASSKTNKAVQQIIDRLQEQIDTFGLSAIGLELYRAKQEGATEADLEMIRTKALQLQSLQGFKLKLTETIPKMEEFTPPVIEGNTALAGFVPNTEDATQGLALLSQALGTAGKKIEPLPPKMKETSEIGQTLKSGLGSIFDDAIRGGKNVVKLLKDIVFSLAKVIIKLLIIKALKTVFGGVGFLGAFFGEGGEVKAAQFGASAKVGELLVVGERGPELFVPDVPGEIIPSARMGSPPGLLAMEPLEESGRGGRTVVRMHNEFQGVITGDTLMQLVENLNRMVQGSDVELVSTFSIAPAISRS